MEKRVSNDKKLHAYVIGLALGDGNLSNPNGRAVRLRITCDKKYPRLNKYIFESIKKFLPDNKVSIQNSKTYLNISCYSNKWENLLRWKSGKGSKYEQKVKIPSWVLKSKSYTRECLKGLIQTDGSIYTDRGYKMVNIVCNIKPLAMTIVKAIQFVGYKPNIQIHQDQKTKKYTIRISKDVNKFIKDIKLWKS